MRYYTDGNIRKFVIGQRVTVNTKSQCHCEGENCNGSLGIIINYSSLFHEYVVKVSGKEHGVCFFGEESLKPVGEKEEEFE